MTYATIAAGVMLVALIIYALSAGADFGGGLWELLAFGSRKEAQRDLIDDAIAPIWEANHVWLILIVVLLFVCFPSAFSVASIALHIPLAIMLVGIVLRGSAFAFRHYAENETLRRRWSRIFAVSSAATPFFLGVCVGAITEGRIRLEDGIPDRGFIGSWLGWFPMAVGGFTLSLFALLAAVYLTNETDDHEIQDDFRKSAVAAGVFVALFAAVAAFSSNAAAERFGDALFHSIWSWPLQIATGAAAVGVFFSLFTRRFRTARVLAIAQVSLILIGWGAAHGPMLIAPDVTIGNAAAPEQTIRATLIALAAGSVILAPSFLFLLRTFKRREVG